MRLFALILLALPWQALSNSILGIDLGTSFFKLALVTRGSPLQVVTNQHSKRKTENMVLFDNGGRFFGSDASSLLGRKGGNVPVGMGVMLGRNITHPSVQQHISMNFPINPTWNATSASLMLALESDPLHPYKIEDLSSMILTHSRELARSFIEESGGDSNTLPKDAVLTVPSFYTYHERSALLNACELAGLNVLSLIEENTASALNYGMDKVLPLNSTETILFYNLGATSTQVSIVKYESQVIPDGIGRNKTIGTINVMGKGWDATLGGSSFDTLILDDLIAKFDDFWHKKMPERKGQTVKDNGRAMTRLRIQATKIKEVLSANANMPVYVEQLLDDLDFKYDITRERFEVMAKDLFERSTKPIEIALKSAGLSIKDVTAVELIGGGMRIPKLQESLTTLLTSLNTTAGSDEKSEAVELGLHINSDESMALGAAFHGANISTAFKVRRIGMEDRTMWGVGVRLGDLKVEEKVGLLGGLFGKKEIVKEKKEKKEKTETDDEESGDDDDDDEWTKKATVFKPLNKLGAKKSIAFSHDKDISIAVVYEEAVEGEVDYLPKGTERTLVRYNVTGVAKFAEAMKTKGVEGKPKVSMQFELGLNGIVKVLKCEVVGEEIIEVEVEEEVELEGDELEVALKKRELDAAVKEAEIKAAKEVEEAEVEEEVEEVTEEKAEGDAEVDESTGDEKEKKTTKKADKETAKETRKERVIRRKTEKAEKEALTKTPTKVVKVMRDKKKTHKKALNIISYNDGTVMPMSDVVFKESANRLENLLELDRQRMLIEGGKNLLESYIYSVKSKFEEEIEDLEKVSTEEQRTKILADAEAAEEWLYDSGDASYEDYVAKHAEIKDPADAMYFRLSELEDRPKAFTVTKEKCGKIRELMAKWETSMPQITAEEREDVLSRIEVVEKWLEEKIEEQSKVAVFEVPVVGSEEIGMKSRETEKMVTKLSKRPKPKVVEVKKNETESEEGEGEGVKEDAESATEEAEPTETKEKKEEEEEGEVANEKGEGEGEEFDGGSEL